ncbi:MAG: AbrB/MazE/SpoVT family DNA-binding domain-containing protein [Candidatus Omnitrophica bacterium]|nr:AbrB/MazE/SpoVT family DNA-binding domain-containing protein [Candidatus Omnitrophota bacterium]
MTITMTEKHQITIPKKIADVLHLKRGSMFSVELRRNRIELIPVEMKEKKFTAEDYQKLDLLFKKGRGQEKVVTQRLVSRLKQGKI